jgi:hypothetical protein
VPQHAGLGHPQTISHGSAGLARIESADRGACASHPARTVEGPVFQVVDPPRQLARGAVGLLVRPQWR